MWCQTILVALNWLDQAGSFVWSRELWDGCRGGNTLSLNTFLSSPKESICLTWIHNNVNSTMAENWSFSPVFPLGTHSNYFPVHTSRCSNDWGCRIRASILCTIWRFLHKCHPPLASPSPFASCSSWQDEMSSSVYGLNFGIACHCCAVFIK